MEPQPATHNTNQPSKTRVRLGVALVSLTSLAVLLSSCHEYDGLFRT